MIRCHWYIRSSLLTVASLNTVVLLMVCLSGCFRSNQPASLPKTENLSKGQANVHFVFSANTLDISYLAMQFEELALVDENGRAVVVTPETGLSINFAALFYEKRLLLSALVPEGRYTHVSGKVKTSSIDMKALWKGKLTTPLLYNLYGNPVTESSSWLLDQSIGQGFSVFPEATKPTILEVNLDITASHTVLTLDKDKADRTLSPVLTVSQINEGSNTLFSMQGSLVDTSDTTFTIKVSQKKGHTGSIYSIALNDETEFLWGTKALTKSAWLDKVKSSTASSLDVSVLVHYQGGRSSALTVRMMTTPENYLHQGVRLPNLGYIGGVANMTSTTLSNTRIHVDSQTLPMPVSYRGVSANAQVLPEGELVVPSELLLKIVEASEDNVTAELLAFEQYPYPSIDKAASIINLSIQHSMLNPGDYIAANGIFTDQSTLSVHQWQIIDDPKLTMMVSLPIDVNVAPLIVNEDGEIVFSDDVKQSAMMMLSWQHWPMGLLPEGDVHPLRLIRPVNYPKQLTLITTNTEQETLSYQSLLVSDWVNTIKTLIDSGWEIKKINANGHLLDNQLLADAITLHFIEQLT
ncbi:MAG: hypothetical protein OXE99_10870, partial [Cellvibrionales bacterium]|nr:hypothetical protein [Cellvibrionales bacterium]